MSTEIEKYIDKRYERWLDYAIYHCTQAGMPDEAIDVLNEVLCSLLQKNRTMLLKLLHTKKNGYTELDFFILKMIKLNATSDTSPYRNKYKAIPKDDNVEYSRLEIIDEMSDQEDKPNEILDKIHIVREIFESLDLSPKAKRIFEYRFFEGEGFSDWQGEEKLKELYEIYNGVVELIRQKLSGQSIF